MGMHVQKLFGDKDVPYGWDCIVYELDQGYGHAFENDFALL